MRSVEFLMCTFQGGALFCTGNAKYWPIWALLLQMYEFFGAPFTGLNIAAVLLQYCNIGDV